MRPLVLALLALLALAPAAARAEDTGPPLSVPAADLAKAVDCPKSLAGVTRAPVLLIPGTNLEPKANFVSHCDPALAAADLPWCALTLTRYGTCALWVAASYLGAALRRM